MHGCAPRLATLLSFLTLVVPASAAAAQTSVAAPFPAVVGDVRALLVDGSTAYIGGEFTSIGYPTGGMVALSRSDGSVVRAFPGIAGNDGDPNRSWPRVNALTPDGRGGWFAAGHFLHADGLDRRSIVHVLADGNIDPGFRADTPGYVRALALHGDMLWVGGEFGSIGGEQRWNLAALDADTGDVLPQTANLGYIDALRVAGDRLYVGRESEDGLVAALDPDTGAVLPWTSDMVGNSVDDIEVDGDTVYVAGDFWVAGGETRYGAAALSASDGTALPGDFGLNSFDKVRDLALTADAVVLGGSLRRSGDPADHAMLAYDRTTRAPLARFDDVRGSVYALAASGDTVYAYGVTSEGFAAFDAASGARKPWGPGSSAGLVTDLAVIGDQVIAAGATMTGLQQRGNAAAVDLRTGQVLPWNPNVDGTFSDGPAVYALAKRGDDVFLGGAFIYVGDALHKHLAAVDASTGALRPTVPEASLDVNALALSGSDLYVGGNFSDLGGQSRRGLGAVSLVDGHVLPFGPRVDCAPRALAVSGETLHVGGCFTTVDGRPVNRLASFDLTTGARSSTFTAQADEDVVSLLPDGSGGVWVGGGFYTLGGVTTPNLGHLAADGHVDPAPVPIGGQAWSLARDGDELYVGAWGRFGDQPRTGLGSIDLAGGSVTTFDPAPDGVVHALATLPGGGLLAGGTFSTTRWRSGQSLARFGGTVDAGAAAAATQPETRTAAAAAPAQRQEATTVRIRVARRTARRIRLRVYASAATRLRLEIRASRHVVGRRVVTPPAGRWTAVTVAIRVPRRHARIRAVARDAATGATLARSGLLRVGR
jgi:hypothetical protein